jgi:transposase-like protein
MAETRRKFDHDFWEGAVRLVRETGKPIAEVARDLGINAGTLGNPAAGRPGPQDAGLVEQSLAVPGQVEQGAAAGFSGTSRRPTSHRQVPPFWRAG